MYKVYTGNMPQLKCGWPLMSSCVVEIFTTQNTRILLGWTLNIRVKSAHNLVNMLMAQMYVSICNAEYLKANGAGIKFKP